MDMPRLLDGRLKVRHLILVDTLGTHATVVAAARALHVTQPVVTRSLQDLENILGVALYVRGPRGITPTEFGEAFTVHARAVLSQLTQAARHVAELADAERGTVVVGTHLAGSNVLLPHAIAALKAAKPLVTIIVKEGSPEALLVDLEAGRVDLIVGRLTAPSSDGVTRHALYNESVHVVVGDRHPLANAMHVELEDLIHFPWILPGSETVLRRELESLLVQHGLPLPENRVETTSFLTVRELLLRTEMVAVMPSLIASEDPRITALPIVLDRVGHSVGLTVQTERRLGPAASALIDALREAARAMRPPQTDPA